MLFMNVLSNSTMSIFFSVVSFLSFLLFSCILSVHELVHSSYTFIQGSISRNKWFKVWTLEISTYSQFCKTILFLKFGHEDEVTINVSLERPCSL